MFVGGIQHGTSENDLKEYFGKFGEVTEVVIMFDKITTRCRGFGFVTFDNEDCVDKCCDERYHIINSKRVSFSWILFLGAPCCLCHNNSLQSG